MGFQFSDYADDLTRRLFLIFCLFILYYLGALLGGMMAIPPGYATIVWPSSGIALAAILLFGYRIWPGILLGSFLYNIQVFHPQFEISSLGLGILTSSIIGIFASIQACVGAWLLHHFENEYFLETPRGIFKFIIIAMVSCVINSTIGVVTVILAGKENWHHFFELWTTWWVGDSVGVLVATPFLLSWVRYPINNWNVKRIIEVLLFLMAFTITEIIVVSTHLPLFYLVFPFPLWAAFRFGYAGLTTTVVLMNLWVLLATIKGMGPFAQVGSLLESLFLMKSFIVASMVILLFFMSALVERAKVKQLLLDYNRDLENTVSKRTAELNQKISELQEMQLRIMTQERLSSLGAIAGGIAHEIKSPLSFIYNFSELSINHLEKLMEELNQVKDKLGTELFEKIDKKFPMLIMNIKKIKDYADNADHIIQGILNHSKQQTGVLKEIDLHSLIERSFSVLYQQKRLQEITLQIEFQKEFDPAVTTILAIEQDISRVFLNLIDNAIYYLANKKAELGKDFLPILRITTMDLGDKIQISIWDNGPGIAKENLTKIFSPFFSTKSAGEGTGLGLSVCYDIVTKMHHGQLQVLSEIDKFTLIMITLPKSPPVLRKDDH